MELLKYCFYINLNERTDRLEHIRNELYVKLGLNKEGTVGGDGVTERFAAIKMEMGAVGCSLSHIRCLKMAKERNYPYVFICEDDFLCINPELLKKNLAEFVNSVYSNTFDVLIIGGNNWPPFHKETEFCLKVGRTLSTVGYVVRNHYYDTLIGNMKEGVNNLMRNPNRKKEFSLDVNWCLLQQKDKWYMLIPATVTQTEGYSDIEKDNKNYNHLLLCAFKQFDYGKNRWVAW